VPIASERESILKIEAAHRLDPLSGETIPYQKPSLFQTDICLANHLGKSDFFRFRETNAVRRENEDCRLLGRR
jgi:hypothetical protein